MDEMDRLRKEAADARARCVELLRERAEILRWCAYLGARLNAPAVEQQQACVIMLNNIQRIAGVPIPHDENDHDLH